MMSHRRYVSGRLRCPPALRSSPPPPRVRAAVSAHPAALRPCRGPVRRKWTGLRPSWTRPIRCHPLKARPATPRALRAGRTLLRRRRAVWRRRARRAPLGPAAAELGPRRPKMLETSRVARERNPVRRIARGARARGRSASCGTQRSYHLASNRAPTIPQSIPPWGELSCDGAEQTKRSIIPGGPSKRIRGGQPRSSAPRRRSPTISAGRGRLANKRSNCP